MNVRILIISRNAWNNSSGDTLTNFFQDSNENELAQIYCRDELPNNNLCLKYYKISESLLLKSILKRKCIAGESVNVQNIYENKRALLLAKKEKKLYDRLRNKRFILLLWLRELLWIVGRWKSVQLEKFISEFNPDIIYTDAYDTFYTYRLLHYAQSVAKVPYVIFHSDDHVTFRQFSLNPFFWINRGLLRFEIQKAVRLAALNYCITDEQKRLYGRIFNQEFKILTKCADFGPQYNSYKPGTPVKMTFAGNIYYDRWKTLEKLSQAIESANRDGKKVELSIYTGNPVSKRIYRKLYRKDSVLLKGHLPYAKISEIQQGTDILVHVESFNLKQKLLTSLSFSTKLVDYFESGRCILAIGWEKAASIKYLKDNDAALIVTDLNQIQNTLKLIIQEPLLINEYGRKAFDCGKRNHDRGAVLKSFRADLKQISLKAKVTIKI